MRSAADLDASWHLQKFVSKRWAVRQLTSVLAVAGQRQLQVPQRSFSQLVRFVFHLCFYWYILSKPLHFRRYIRLGYDPRTAPAQSVLEQSAAWYQPIPIRLSSTLWNVLYQRNPGGAARTVDDSVGDGGLVSMTDGNAAEAADTNSHNLGSETGSIQKPWLKPSPEDSLLSPASFRCFAILPVQVRHPLFEEWKTQMRPLPAYDHINGWIPSEALDAMRDVVQKALEGMLAPEESRSLSALEKQHERAADGRKGRQYTSLRRALHRRGEYGRVRIEELAALAPHAPAPASAAADSAPARESQSQQPAASARAASGATARKIRDSKVVAGNVDVAKHDANFEAKSSQPSAVEIMSQLSSAAFNPFHGGGAVCPMCFLETDPLAQIFRAWLSLRRRTLGLIMTFSVVVVAIAAAQVAEATGIDGGSAAKSAFWKKS